MAHNQRFNANDEKYDPEATEALRKELGIGNGYRSQYRINLPTVKRLIRAGADPRLLQIFTDADYDNPYRNGLAKIAVMYGDSDFLQELFRMGIEPTADLLADVIEKFGSEATVDKHLRVVEAILNENPDLVNETIDDNPYTVNNYRKTSTPLIQAIERDIRDRAVLPRLLLERGANPDLQNSLGQTPLIVATMLDHTRTIQLLKEHGADPELQDKEGKSAEDYMKEYMKEYENNSNGGGYKKSHRKHKTRRHKRKSRKNRKTSRRH